MAYYGFRLFEIELRELNGRKPVPFEDCAGEHYSVIAHRILKRSIGKTVVEDRKADPDAIDDGLEGDPFAGRRGVRVMKVKRHGHTIWADILVGRFGEQEIAQGAPGVTEDSEIKGRAPSDIYRFGFYFPDDGTRGVVAVEDISRKCPIDLVRNLLRDESKKDAEAKANKKPKPGEEEKVPKWWKLIITPMIDQEQVERMIERGKSQRVELKKHSIGAGRGRDALEYEFSAPGLTDTQRNELAGLIADWGRAQIRRRRAPAAERAKMDVPSNSEGARALAAIFGQQVEALDFDDGYVVVVDDEGKSKNISPTQLNEVFTYPLNRNGRPSDVAFHGRSRQTAQRLARAAKLTGMEWPEKQ